MVLAIMLISSRKKKETPLPQTVSSWSLYASHPLQLLWIIIHVLILICIQHLHWSSRAGPNWVVRLLSLHWGSSAPPDPPSARVPPAGAQMKARRGQPASAQGPCGPRHAAVALLLPWALRAWVICFLIPKSSVLFSWEIWIFSVASVRSYF